MKTLQTLKSSSLISLFAAFLFSLTSCQKDEMPVAYQSAAAPVDLAAPTQQFDMLEIDHASAGTDVPDYNVKLRSDGKVVFEGRNNTATSGMRTFPATDDQMNEVADVITSYDMKNMSKDDIKVELASTTVSYKEAFNTAAITRSANDDEQTALIEMTKKIEIILGIDLYIEKDIKQ